MTNLNDMYLLAGSEELSRKFNELASMYSDFHKDVHGVRPRHMALCADRYKSHEALAEAYSRLCRLYDGLNDYVTAVRSTFKSWHY